MIPVEEVVTGLLVDAIAGLGRQAAAAFTPLTGRRQRANLDIAGSFNSYALLDRAFPAPPSGIDETEFMARLRGNEVQALIQELLAVRLSDGPELTTRRLREEFIRTCGTPYAEQIFDELDAQASNLAVYIANAQPQLLRQIREEAHFTRLNATVEAIQRHLAALQVSFDPRADQEFLEGYRRHVIEYHGMIEPPDFARRRRVPIADLYVQPNIVGTRAFELPSEHNSERRSVDLLEGREVDRTVLLGNPGAGKTTASHVLLHHYASNPELRVPFVVILRDFAANNPPQWSVLEFIEHRLRTFYQSSPPGNIINRLLLTGGALVVFDGLDELIDTSRRAEVSAIIEQFCIEYPLTHVLVTSRIVGYDEARLDERQFEILRIEDFDDGRVSSYVHKWFLNESGIPIDEATSMASALLDESSNIRDLRSNPLMLALICILYRGERSIPQSRADVYEKCADLLFRRWDAHRKIYVELRARHLVEPAMRYLAYWMLTRDAAQANVTRRQLISETAKYFQERGFDELHDAQAAAEEFVDFCRGRAWVFTDVGTTADGEQIYTFTHRTFLEYFAANYLASIYDVPEALARSLAPRVARGEWDMVGQLAVQMKDRSIERGGERIFIELLGDRRKRTVAHRANILTFLTRCLSAVQPRTSIVRELTTDILDLPMVPEFIAPDEPTPLVSLLENWKDSSEPVVSALRTKIDTLLSTRDQRDNALALELACCLPDMSGLVSRLRPLWPDFAAANLEIYASELREAAATNDTIWWLMVNRGVASPEAAIAMLDNNLSRLFRTCWYRTFRFGISSPIYGIIRSALSRVDAGSDFLSALGRYLSDSQDWPKVNFADTSIFDSIFFRHDPSLDKAQLADIPTRLEQNEAAYLGLLFCLSIGVETVDSSRKLSRSAPQIRMFTRRLAVVNNFAAYLSFRLFGRPDPTLPLEGLNTFPSLGLGHRYDSIFSEWANGTIDFCSGRYPPGDPLA